MEVIQHTTQFGARHRTQVIGQRLGAPPKPRLGLADQLSTVIYQRVLPTSSPKEDPEIAKVAIVKAAFYDPQTPAFEIR
ncbi:MULTISPECIES: hypothetical protein [unclassified Sphingomonas]|uniref:hypothetical protein n=1 Tax=unclassified Sphingomonas TaxID=196159 RepID=UPI0012E3B12B|nr:MULTISPECIES: hypothetical protein [unclassified Sphingomonas]